MKTVSKKHTILLLFVGLAIISVFFLRTVPIRTFDYRTSTECNSNAYDGGGIENFEYRMLGGGLDEYRSKMSELKSLNIPQTRCIGNGLAPVDYTTLKLYLL